MNIIWGQRISVQSVIGEHEQTGLFRIIRVILRVSQSEENVLIVFRHFVSTWRVHVDLKPIVFTLAVVKAGVHSAFPILVNLFPAVSSLRRGVDGLVNGRLKRVVVVEVVQPLPNVPLRTLGSVVVLFVDLPPEVPRRRRGCTALILVGPEKPGVKQEEADQYC